MLSRRELIGKAAVGAAAALAVGGMGTAVAATRPLRMRADGTETPTADDASMDPRPAARQDATPVPRQEDAPAPWALLAPYAAGAEVAYGWRLVDLSPVRDGAAVATLQNARGRAYRVHLCRNDGDPQGVIHTRRVDLVVMNQGYGELPTEEHMGQAVVALAHVVAANERTVADAVFAALEPHSERVQRFAAAETLAAEGKLR
ncbi:MAG: hypothetical protein OZ922_17085 [Myxococcales bacterium]|jgi:hypothetical protein|nr:hypothetical protein [Myxococcales bacterium]